MALVPVGRPEAEGGRRSVFSLGIKLDLTIGADYCSYHFASALISG